ncbi:HAMP domain-containing sensor histidine kinase [Acrocarpospora macrocephala]|uniref:histidine kinase n=1 Tax=Acrocarpospora macrocephala TaxID=150177 RepID=A0A5M3WGA2_9ACTN|nr:HAMP domain-containing sensor histidine kinase [Acrocarpospora macrocephala]GES07310.1 two-component sensor histidine kinase [Acrocarpospora macrocephala]
MRASPETTSLRRRVLSAIVLVAALTVLLFAAPLAVAVSGQYRGETVSALSRDATWIAAAVPDDQIEAGANAITLPTGVPAGLTVGVYSVDGRLLHGSGPASSALVRQAADGHPHEGTEDGFLAATAPIPGDANQLGVVRVATPVDGVEDRIEAAWLLMAGLAAVVIALAAVFGLRQSARLAAPLEHLTRAAQALGDGDFTVRPPRSDISEADAAGRALAATATRLGAVLERERSFSTHVSHQLRTQLAGMLLGLESALSRPAADRDQAIRTAIERGERLHLVIDDLVGLARDTRTGHQPLDVAALLAEVRADWHGRLAAQGRRLTITMPAELPPVSASPPAVRQILRVLLDNALVHGAAEVAVDVTEVGDAVAVEVADQGPGMADDADPFARRTTAGDGHGIGLALARSLAEAEAGRLILRRARPPVFALLLSPPRSPR